MSDALSEALMKLAAVKPVPESSLPSADLPATTPDHRTAATETEQTRSWPDWPQTPADFAESCTAPAIPAASENTSAAQPTASPVLIKPAASAFDWWVRIRELRGWVAAGIILAILFTVVDDLRRHGQARNSTEIAASGAADVNLDELLREFETADSSSRLQDNRTPEPERTVQDTESEVTASYDDVQMESADESAVSGAGTGVVRFSGRIEPLR
jgi:hypothetical protein